MNNSEKIYNAVLDTESRTQQTENELTVPSLPFCILMDVVGMASYLVPGVGETFDLVWAPISGFIFLKAFGGMTGKIGGLISMMEEALPFVDIVPTFTIGHFYAKHQLKKTKK
ncbi:MAG: hypothetical protein ACYC2P_11955 [Paludibacteraceae bacterium]